MVLLLTAGAYYTITTDPLGSSASLSLEKHAAIVTVLGFYLAFGAAAATTLNYFFKTSEAPFKKQKEGPPKNKIYAMI